MVTKNVYKYMHSNTYALVVTVESTQKIRRSHCRLNGCTWAKYPCQNAYPPTRLCPLQTSSTSPPDHKEQSITRRLESLLPCHISGRMQVGPALMHVRPRYVDWPGVSGLCVIGVFENESSARCI